MFMNNQQPTSSLRVVGISGSLRSGSYNTQALRLALRHVAELGAGVEEIPLKELNLPLFNEDLAVDELPAQVKQLKTAIEHADLLLIATPEYNHSIPGVLKNAIDWLSYRKNSFDGKTAVIVGVSNGAYGTIRAQAHLRQILAALNVHLAPQPQVFIGNGAEAFAADGSLSVPKVREQLKTLLLRSMALAQSVKVS